MIERRYTLGSMGSSVRQMLYDVHRYEGPGMGMSFAKRMIWEAGQVLQEVYDPAFAAEVIYAAADEIAGGKDCTPYLDVIQTEAEDRAQDAAYANARAIQEDIAIGRAIRAPSPFIGLAITVSVVVIWSAAMFFAGLLVGRH